MTGQPEPESEWTVTATVRTPFHSAAVGFRERLAGIVAEMSARPDVVGTSVELDRSTDRSLVDQVAEAVVDEMERRQAAPS